MLPSYNFTVTIIQFPEISFETGQNLLATGRACQATEYRGGS